MFIGLRFRPIGWIVGFATIAAMAGTMALATPGGASAPETPFSAAFEAQCVLAPHVLNLAGTAKVVVRGDSPEGASVGEGQQFGLTHATISITTPKEWGEDFVQLGVHSIEGNVTHVGVDATNAAPAGKNIATPPEFASGLPINAPVENAEIELSSPSAERTFAAGPWNVTGHKGESVELALDPGAAYRETSTHHFEATGEGIVAELSGLNESGEVLVGPLQIACTAPPAVTLARLGITAVATSIFACTTTSPLRPQLTIEPDQGPPSGGTEVVMSASPLPSATDVFFGAKPAESFDFLGMGKLIAVTPPGTGTVGVSVGMGRNACGFREEAVGEFTYISSAEKAEDHNWSVSGSFTPKRLAQPVILPAGSTFNGNAELTTETGAGSVKGQIAVPPFTSTLKLFGVLPVTLGMTFSQLGPFAGTVAKSESAAGKELLTIPAHVAMGVTSLRLGGLTVAASCSTAEPLSLNLLDTLTAEELLRKGWQFAGSTPIPRVKCEGPLGGLLGSLLSVLLSGPEAAYTLAVRAPGA
jgi:hypothetical protein